MIAHDIKLDANGDLFINDSGDFEITESDAQHIKDIMQSAPGWFKKFPLVGFNPTQYINSKNTLQSINTNARIQLESDGYLVQDINIAISPEGAITGNIDASRL